MNSTLRSHDQRWPQRDYDMLRLLLLKSLLAFTAVLSAALPTRAQGLLPSSEPADQQIRAALATPYAAVSLQNFVKSVRKHADAACLAEKGFDDAAIAARGTALMQRYGEQMLKLMDDNVDRATYEKVFKENAGPRGLSEFEQLKRDPEVKEFIAIYLPAGQTKTVDSIVENFDRFILIGRFKFDSISPIARGEEPPKYERAEAAAAAARAFMKAHPRKINRYLDLLDVAIDARGKAISQEARMRLGPMAFFAGAERELAELCIGRK